MQNTITINKNFTIAQFKTIQTFLNVMLPDQTSPSPITKKTTTSKSKNTQNSNNITNSDQ